MASAYRAFDGDTWVGRDIEIEGHRYRFEPDTDIDSAATMAYARMGGRATVYKLARHDGQSFALKVFTRRYSLMEYVALAVQLRTYQSTPGLRVCEREVVTDRTADALGEPGLAWSILMPWIDGEPWVGVVDTEHALSEEKCLGLARRTAAILSNLEKRGLVHADLSGGNVIVTDLETEPSIELIDVEDMYFVWLPDQRPDPPDGSPGYGHPHNQGHGCRNPYGDRFAGAILLAEMLSWHDPRIRQGAGDVSVFDQEELCRASVKYELVREVLLAHSAAVADLFEQAWRSPDLKTCPPLADWQAALDGARRAPAPESAAVPDRSTGRAVADAEPLDVPHYDDITFIPLTDLREQHGPG